jgi:hypothetical protein
MIPTRIKLGTEDICKGLKVGLKKLFCVCNSSIEEIQSGGLTPDLKGGYKK